MRVVLALLVASVALLLSPAWTWAALEWRGAQVHPWWPGVSSEVRERELDQLSEAGATTVRMDMPWAAVEPRERGAVDEDFLTRVERFIAAARARGIRPVMTLHSVPCWASSAPDTVKSGCTDPWGDVNWYPPSDSKDIARISGYLARRFGRDLAAMEIWNEPNHENFLSPADLTPRDRADRYMEMLRAAYPSIKEADASLPVIGGAVEGTDSEFLQLLYERGLAESSDGISFHPYNGPHGPGWERPDDWDPRYDFKGGISRMHAVMEANGDGDAPVWLTELGWTTCTDGSYRCVSEDDQARFTAEAFRMIREDFPFVRGALVYELRDSRDGGCSECRFGVLRRDFSPKPAWLSFKRAMVPYVERILSTGALVSYWRLGEDSGTVARDEGGASAGAYTTSAGLGAPGIPGADGDTAVALGGSGGRMSAPHDSAYHLDGFTVEVWVKVHDAGDSTEWRTLVKKGDGPADRTFALRLLPSSVARLRMTMGTPEGVYLDGESERDLELERWHHLVLAHPAGGPVALYVDGDLAARSADSGVPASNAEPVVAGPSGSATKVAIDELAIYRRALDADEVRAHFRAGLDDLP